MTNMFDSIRKIVLPIVSKNEILDPEVKQTSEITLSEIPSYIEKCINQLQELEKKVKASEEAGRLAAKEAKEAENKKATFAFYESKEKEQAVIQALQTSGVAQAEAIETFSEAQKLTFDYLSDVMKVLRGLFVLGCASLAKNRVVVRELEARLRGDSEAQINELARQELESLMMQLNEQRDILERQEKLGANQREQAELISINKDSIQKNKEKNVLQDQELERQAAKVEEHNKRLNDKDAKDVEHDRRLNEKDEKDKRHDERLDDKDAKDIQHDKRLDDLSIRVKKLESTKIPLWMKITVILSFVLSVISIFISLAKY